MVRSMYSGVAGMKAHQIRMDVIGNNISNVNTYGFKSSRATFRDVYYQSLRGAAAGTGTRGGLNPSQVGYGATIGSIDVMQTQSTMTTTGNPLDVAITGEGFLQVQDADGNIFYTKAGMLNVDSYGNLIDSNGNFVLGVSGSPIGQAPASNRIQFSIPSVDPRAASISETINAIKYTLKASKESNEGNISFNFLAANDMAYNQKAEAVITSSGINIRLNAKETFENLEQLNDVINEAIKTANGGLEHPAGTFTLEMDPQTKFQNLTGAEITGKNFGIKQGVVPIPTALAKYMSVAAVGDKFVGEGATDFLVANTKAATAGPPATPAEYTFTVTIGPAGPTQQIYKATLTSEQMKSPSSVILKTDPETAGNTITLNIPSENSLLQGLVPDSDNDGEPDKDGSGQYAFPTTPYTATGAIPSKPSNDLGLSNKPFKLENGTVGGVQSVKDLSGIAIGADGVIIGSHPVHGRLELGRIDLATFENAQGLAQSGDTYFAATPNSGNASLTQPGLGGSGGLATSALEMSNVDLSQEFADMITTQRGFQANSRLITVSDTMLEELINLKR